MGNTGMNFVLVPVCFHKDHLLETNRFNHLFVLCIEFKIISEEKAWRTLVEFNCVQGLGLQIKSSSGLR